MKNTLTLIALCLFLIGTLTAQNGQNIVFNLAKKNKNLTLNSLKISKTGIRGVGSITTTPLLVELKNPEPFIAFSMSIEGSSLSNSLITIELQTQIDGKWSDWQTLESNHDFEENAKKYVSNMRELDKTTTAIRLRVSSKSADMRLKTVKIRLFAAGNVSTGSTLNTPEGICSKPALTSRSTWGAAWSTASIGSSLQASQYSPRTNTLPSRAIPVSATPSSPISPSRPVVGRRRWTASALATTTVKNALVAKTVTRITLQETR